MHKKPLVAVLIFGLLLVLPLSVTEARVDPGNGLNPGAQPLPYIARGLDKGPVNSSVHYPDPLSNIQAGVSRTAATFCDGEWQGGPYYYVPGWLYGDEYYAVYQDPEDLGQCAGLNDIYTFDVTAINWALVVWEAGTYHIQPIVYESAGEIACPVPGGVLCAGPVYELTFTTGDVPGGYILSFPFTEECCVFGPYFAGAYFADYIGPDIVDVYEDDGSVATEVCKAYNDYGGGWLDLVDDVGFGLNLELWSEGNAYDQNNCPGLPGICDYQAWYNGVAFFWTSPDGNAAEDYFTRYTADFSCTLQTFRFAAYCSGTAGTEPTYRVTLFGTNGPTFSGRMYPQAFGIPFDPLDPNVVESFEIPWANINCYPNWTEVDFTDYAFGPGQDIIISVSLSENTPDPGTDVMAILSDDGGSPNGRSGFYVGALGDWYYNDEVFTDYDWVFEAYICCEQVEAAEAPCASPGPDDWNTYAHDYERTSATTIEVGDPCQINPIWYQDQEQAINYTQATATEDRVYISNDAYLHVYNLASGALINTVTGLPWIFSTNRGNTTIDGGYAYVTGGTGQSISQWDLDLTADNWVNGVGGDNPPLGADTRFGGAVYISGLDIVIIGTTGGNLFAFNALDGTLYGGWGTNPVPLDAAVYHPPAYDGTNLYVGTTTSALSSGSVYSIDAATGAINWNFLSGNLDGFPAGVSLDGGDLYTASVDQSGNTGFRYKLNKTTGAAQWSFAEQRALYGTPAIGRNFVYIGLDQSNLGGIFAIDKNTGAPVHNFATDGVGRVTQHVTITCDAYAFAGDRNGKWWLLDLVNFEPVWNIEVPFFSVVNGTAVTSNSLGDTHYAIMSTQTGGIGPGTGGMIAAYQFNSGARPLVEQHVYSTLIGVEFGTLAGIPYTESGVFSNIGCADLNFTAFNIYDPAPDVVANRFNHTQAQYAAAVASRSVDAGYNTYIEPGKISKTQRILDGAYNAEESNYNHKMVDMATAMKTADKPSTSRMVAGSAIVRTSAVSVINPLPAGATTDVDWLYDGTGLERGIDDEVIEFITDDPDRLMWGTQPYLDIRYQGGCFNASTVLTWNTLDVTRVETNYNDGQLGDDDEANDLDWDGTGSQDVFDAGFYLAGEWDSVAVPAIAQFHQANVYDNYSDEFLPDPFPGPSCDFQGDEDVLMGYKREGGCPGTPTEIRGQWVRTAYIDTNLARVGTFGEAIGTRIVATEIGAYDPAYGDFKLRHWEVTNRDAVDKGPIYAGTFHDWDVRPNYATNIGFHSLAFNGYAIYDFVTPELAFGVFDPNLPTAYGGFDATYNRPQRINPFGEGPDASGEGLYNGPWQSGQDSNPWEELWVYAVSRTPQFETGPSDPASTQNPTYPHQDWGGIMTMKGQMLPAEGTISFNEALYAVDAAGGDELAMEANAVELAGRAAKWAGFARGDVNDDNVVNLLDVCWLLSGQQIYPDTYNGDVNVSGGVDAADELYLLNYVTGLGPAPEGEWRFAF